MTKYDFDMPIEVITADLNRLTNQLWKLIPMRENEENWGIQLDTVIVEIAGLNEIFNEQNNYLVLLSKLEGLRISGTEFEVYRKTVFECISLLRGLQYEQP